LAVRDLLAVFPTDENARMIDGLTNTGALPALERMVQFSGQRHRLIANNIANLDTPGYRPVDVAPAEFQQAMAEAIDRKRAAGGPGAGRGLAMSDTSRIEFHADGLSLKPEPVGAGMLFHDGNDRDLEAAMQDLVENFAAFRFAAQMIRHQFESLNTAIRERI
jgi:flagellar basal-body rod protein FlgB